MRKGLLRKKNMLVYLLCGLLVLTGCAGGDKEEIPELMDSLVNNDAYRPVTYGTIGDIGNLEDARGVVVPREDCYFFNSSAKIEDINVEVGDYVEAGTVLATIRLDEIEKTIQDLQNTLKYRQDLYSQEQKIYEETIEKFDYQIKAYQDATDQTGAKAAISDIKSAKAMEEENHLYDEIIYKRECRKLKEEISEQQKLLSEGRLVARNSGYVTYVKDISESTEAQASENVVIVSDYNDKYIEVKAFTLDDTAHTQAESVFTSYNGKRCELTLFSYSQEEVAMMQAKDEYPFIKYEVPKEMDVEVGDLMPVCYTRKNVSNVLIVGLDSVYQEGNDTFVYVKTESSDKERRDITIGAKDQHYAEVTSGLSEGEEVYYISTSMTPANYKNYKVELSDYSVSVKGNSFKLENTREFEVIADKTVTVVDVKVTEGDTVKEGDLLFRINTEGGKADLQAASDAIKAEEDSYKQISADYRKQIADIDRQMEEAADAQKKLGRSTGELLQQESLKGAVLEQKAVSGTEPEQSEDATESGTTEVEASEPDNSESDEPKTDSSEPEPDNSESEPDNSEPEPDDTISADQLYQVEQLKCDKKIAEAAYRISTLSHEYSLKQLKESYNALKAVNDGNGCQNIYAERDGVITKLNVAADKKIVEGATLYIISQETKDKIYVTKYTEGAQLNQRILFPSADQDYYGVCIASKSQAQAGKSYYTTLNGQVYSSQIVGNDNGDESFYVKMEDESFYEKMDASDTIFDAQYMKNAIVLPSSMVYAEIDKFTTNTYYYVWKIIGGNLVKQYVTVSTTMQYQYSASTSDSRVVILAGVDVGDELAQESAVINSDETQEESKKAGNSSAVTVSKKDAVKVWEK